MLMDEDPRVKGSVVPPDVPLHYVLSTLRGNVSPTLANYSGLALTFSPKLYAENPHCFAGSNYEIFSNPGQSRSVPVPPPRAVARGAPSADFSRTRFGTNPS
jgi:hypothetical protein